MGILDTVYRFSSNSVHNLMIHLFNRLAYRTRYGGRYWEYRNEKKINRHMTLLQLLDYQKTRYANLINHAVKSSEFYAELYTGKDDIANIENLRNLPIVNKEVLRANIEKIRSEDKDSLIKSKTGGTTGKSLEVFYTKNNLQERFAFLDDFRARYGYELGKKTAWFSGKKLLTKGDLRKNRFWKTDFRYKVRYYSTFHIKDNFLKYYVEDLIKYDPEYFVGFPSTILEIAKYGTKKGYQYPKGRLKAIFPTAETVNKQMREVIESFFNTRLYDQYASSEGAPFIFECSEGALHLELQSGVFEVLDDLDNPSLSGRLVVTSFTTEGTPLIRYDIGDSITLSDYDQICPCGNCNPIVNEILGRLDDYVFSVDRGKINLGNVSNTLKDVRGIVKFQVIQDSLDKLVINLVVEEISFNKHMENKFLQNWRDRIGDRMKLEVRYVSEIPHEKSGKFRIVKNNIKHLIDGK